MDVGMWSVLTVCKQAVGPEDPRLFDARGEGVARQRIMREYDRIRA